MKRILRAVAALGFLFAQSARGEEAHRVDNQAPREQGVASYYGEEFRDKPTASGEKFDPQDLTAAHPSLPLGSKVEVENLSTGQDVKVRINDRGPHVPGRNIDLSEKAADRIGVKQSGTAPVEVKVVEDPKRQP